MKWEHKARKGLAFLLACANRAIIWATKSGTANVFDPVGNWW